MSNLLVNAPTGDQQLIKVGEGGGYFDPARVIWDERVDGPLPVITIGGMVRAGNALEFSQSRLDEHMAVVTKPADEKLSEKNSDVRRQTQVLHLREELESLLKGGDAVGAVRKLDEIYQLEKSPEV